MAQVELKTNVVIGGQTTSSFDALGGKLEALGAAIEKLGGHAREFEIDSLNVYRGYEDNMLAAQYALSSQYRSASELTKVMDGLDEAASQWAANSIFHTSDVSQAINEAAHAGWSYEEILEGIPNAMLIAQAGGLDLSEGLDYLVKMMGSTGTEFEDMTTLIDQWSMAANMSATNIGEMGEAFMALGASADFADSTQEIFTLLAALANVGTTGSQAGTALRGAMMRIIAPTTKAENAMELLGADADELEQVLGDENVTNAVKKLQGLGFSAYDAQGRLKPMIQIFTELDECLQGLNEEAQNEIIAAIFPTRNVSTAKAFLAAIENGQIAELFQSIGDSEGYASQGAEIMMSGLTGAIETLKSKWEEFQRSVGEKLAPQIERVAGFLGGIMDAINGMDDTSLQALVDSLSALAITGPGLMMAGKAIKFFTNLGPVASGLLLAGTAAIYAGSKLNALNEISFRENFGTMELDISTLETYVDSLETSFDGQLNTISEWETALSGALSSYETLTGELSATMLTDVLTGKELTPDEQENLKEYAQSIYNAVWAGIENAEASDMTFLEAIFGDHENMGQENVGSTAAQVVSSWYDSVYGEAQQIGAELRNQMTAALQDGELNEAERQAIQSSVDRYNKIMAQIQSQMDAEAYYEQLYKAQSVSWDSVAAYLDENTAKQESDLQALEDAYAAKWAHYRAAYEYAIENNTEFTDFEGNVRRVTEGDWEQFERQFAAEKAKAQQEIYDKYGTLNAAAFNSLMNDSDYAEAWQFAQKGRILENGNYDFTGAFDGMRMDELDALIQQLTDLFNAEGKIGRRLPAGFFETEQGEAINSIMTAVGAAMVQGSAIRDKYYYSGLDRVPTTTTTTGKAEKNNSIPVAFDFDQANRDLNKFKKDTAKKTVDVNAVLNVDDSALRNYNAQDITVGVNVGEASNEGSSGGGGGGVVNWFKDLFSGFAEGGRADEPSVFGEAGPEWAIPEEHSQRTAELLNAARQASGFTWGDLLGRFGGLNANPNHENVTVNYAPTINAADARGVADALAADKERLMKLVRDAIKGQKFRDDVEVYA